jgi:haloalkane dehalogenase
VASEELYPFESHYADIDGARVHCVDEGSGPPLLLLHGNPTWSFLHRDVIRGLRDHFRCIAPRPSGLSRAGPGYGYTPAEHAGVLEQLVTRLDLEDVTMMVQDWGGPIGGYLILRRNFFVEKILPGNVKRHKLSDPVMEAYRGPFPTPELRRPLHVFPREILTSRPFLAEVERGLPALAHRPALNRLHRAGRLGSMLVRPAASAVPEVDRGRGPR